MLVLCACQAVAGGPFSQRAELRGPRFEAVLINGGGKRSSNYLSHLLHVKEFNELLTRAGVPASNITIFNADGTNPGADLAVRRKQREDNFWLLQGTRLEKALKPKVSYESSEIAGADVRPATPEDLQDWFEDAARRLRPGDTLFFYVTDHGTKNENDLTDNYISMWGDKVTLSVRELGDMLRLLDPDVRVVAMMSQCYSGSFANLMYTASNDGVPDGHICGYFSSTAERRAYGCYPENRDKDNVGHSFQFIDALRSTPNFPEAHARVHVTDRTPDVPMRTSDVYLRDLLSAAAKEASQDADEMADRLLREAWLDKARWEPEIRLLDRIGQVFGYFSPRLLAELQQQSTLLPDVSEKFKAYSQRWRLCREGLAKENLKRFLAAQPAWEARISEEAVKSLDERGRRELSAALLPELAAHTAGDTSTAERFDFLKKRSEQAKAARYRMQVRLGVVLRMETILRNIAGRVFLEQHASAAEREAYQALVDCEALVLSDEAASESRLVVPEPFPSYEEELQLAEAILPGWMGVRFRQVSDLRREDYGLQDGAVSVQAVYPDSAALEAGLEVGDIILGPPDALFAEQYRLREWIMTAPIGEQQTLLVQRGGAQRVVTLTPRPFPIKMPDLPGPPKEGSPAPPMDKVQAYRGEIPKDLTKGGPYLLFYWATWCGPCKAALPEVLAFERERNTKVISITDEIPRQLKKFFAQWEDPFPQIVGWDELRRSFLAYAISGTPAFVLIDAEGKVEKAWTGYRASDGLKIPGWTWSPEEQKDETVLTIDGLEIPGSTSSQEEQKEDATDE